jgi:replicative DNA helicase
MAEKNTSLTPFQKEQAEVAKQILEYKLGAEASIVAMIYKNPDLLRETKLELNNFHHNVWKVYFEICRALIIDEKKTTLSELDIGLFLEKHPKLRAKYDEYGGYQMIESAGAYIKEENFDGYVRDLRKWNTIAKLVKQGFPVKDRLSEFCDMSAEEIYQEYEGYINHIFSNIDHEIKSYNALEGLHELVDDLNAGDNIGLPISANLLNQEIGGLKKGNIYSLTAPSGAGKSTILINYILPKMLEYNERCCMFINEEDVKKVKRELLLYCCTNVLKKPIQKVQLRDGHFDEDTLKTLHEAADWLEEQDKNHNLIVIPLEHYTTDIVIKLIKKYKNLFNIDYFILDTFKESSDSKEEGYREMLKSSVKLYDLIKPACLNVCLVMSMQTSKSSLKNRHLTNMDIGQSKSVVDVFSVSLLCRRVEPDEYRDEKKELKCFRVEGKTKIPFTLEKDKYYLLFFIAKNRFGNTDAYSIVSEVDLSTNKFRDIGFVVVPEDW